MKKIALLIITGIIAVNTNSYAEALSKTTCFDIAIKAVFVGLETEKDRIVNLNKDNPASVQFIKIYMNGYVKGFLNTADDRKGIIIKGMIDTKGDLWQEIENALIMKTAKFVEDIHVDLNSDKMIKMFNDSQDNLFKTGLSAGQGAGLELNSYLCEKLCISPEYFFLKEISAPSNPQTTRHLR